MAAAACPGLGPRTGPRPFVPLASSPRPPVSGRVLPQRHARPLDGHGFVPRASRRRVQDPIIPPYITIDTPRGGQDYVDLAGYLLRSRIILISKRITDVVAVQIVASLLALDGLDPQAEIRLYINCAAASPYAVTAILDVLRSLRAPVSTLALGYCGGAASVLLAGGTKGRRCAMPNARIMLVQPSGGAAGSADEVNITTRELNRTMNVMYTFLAQSTGMAMELVEEECDRERYLSPEEAKEMGIIDHVLGQSPDFLPNFGFLQYMRHKW